MAHQFGANIGGISNIEGLRMRCFCDEHSGCWHLRTARGRPMPTARVQRVWVHGVGHVTATRGAWLLHSGQTPPKRHVVARKCDSYDCVNPEHLGCISRATHSRKTAPKKGESTPAQRAALAIAVERQRKLTPELRQWLMESQQSSAAAAHGLGIASSRAAELRRRLPSASVFAWRPSA